MNRIVKNKDMRRISEHLFLETHVYSIPSDSKCPMQTNRPLMNVLLYFKKKKNYRVGGEEENISINVPRAVCTKRTRARATQVMVLKPKKEDAIATFPF